MSPDEDRVVSGGGDGAIVVWRDCTAEDVAAQRAEEDRVAVLSQDLSNMVAQAKYAPAARLAIELERPHQLLKIARAILGSGGQAALGDVLGSLDPAQLEGDLLATTCAVAKVVRSAQSERNKRATAEAGWTSRAASPKRWSTVASASTKSGPRTVGKAGETGEGSLSVTAGPIRIPCRSST